MVPWRGSKRCSQDIWAAQSHIKILRPEINFILLISSSYLKPYFFYILRYLFRKYIAVKTHFSFLRSFPLTKPTVIKH